MPTATRIRHDTGAVSWERNWRRISWITVTSSWWSTTRRHNWSPDLSGEHCGGEAMSTEQIFVYRVGSRTSNYSVCVCVLEATMWTTSWTIRERCAALPEQHWSGWTIKNCHDYNYWPGTLNNAVTQCIYFELRDGGNYQMEQPYLYQP